MSLEPRTKHMTEVVLYIHEPDSRGCVMRLRRLHTDVMRLWIHDIILMTRNHVWIVFIPGGSGADTGFNPGGCKIC